MTLLAACFLLEHDTACEGIHAYTRGARGSWATIVGAQCFLQCPADGRLTFLLDMLDVVGFNSPPMAQDGAIVGWGRGAEIAGSIMKGVALWFKDRDSKLFQIELEREELLIKPRSRIQADERTPPRRSRVRGGFWRALQRAPPRPQSHDPAAPATWIFDPLNSPLAIKRGPALLECVVR
jgi:hypothetical protein